MDTDLSIAGRQLPVSSRVITRLRDLVILDLPSAATKPKPTFTRTAVLLDPQADMRVFDILMAFHYQSLRYRVNLIGLAKMPGGRVRWWYGDPATEQHARRPMQDAIKAALFPFDNLIAEPPVIVPMIEGKLDRDNLAVSDLLRAVPERYQLGWVQA